VRAASRNGSNTNKLVALYRQFATLICSERKAKLKMAKQRVQLNVRLAPADAEKITGLAREQGRSLREVVALLLRENMLLRDGMLSPVAK